jgi:hypothetical protein
MSRKPSNSAILRTRALHILRSAKRIIVVEWSYDLKRHQLRVVMQGLRQAERCRQ